MCVHVRALPKFNMRSLKKRKTKYTYKRERETERRETEPNEGVPSRVLFSYVVGEKIEREKNSLLYAKRLA